MTELNGMIGQSSLQQKRVDLRMELVMPILHPLDPYAAATEMVGEYAERHGAPVRLHRVEAREHELPGEAI